MYKAPTRITSRQYAALGNPKKRLSKNDLERIEKGLEPIPLEDHEAEVFATWLFAVSNRKVVGRPGIVLYTHIPNETRTTMGVAKKLKRQGVKKGFPDYAIVVDTLDGDRCLLGVELKRIEGGTVSKEQKDWIAALSSIDNVDATASKGADAAIAYVEQFI